MAGPADVRRFGAGRRGDEAKAVAAALRVLRLATMEMCILRSRSMGGVPFLQYPKRELAALLRPYETRSFAVYHQVLAEETYCGSAAQPALDL